MFQSDPEIISLCLRFSADGKLSSTNFTYRKRAKIFKVNRWGRQLNAFCRIFVAYKISSLSHSITEDFAISDDSEDYVEVLANTLERSANVLEEMFEIIEAPEALRRIFEPLEKGDNRSGANPDIPRTVRIRREVLSAEAVVIVWDGHERATSRELKLLESALREDGSQRSTGRKKQHIQKSKLGIQSKAEATGANANEAIQAWRESNFAAQCNALVEYYHDLGELLFSYRGKRGRVRIPLFVRKEWLNLDRSSLILAPLRAADPYRPTVEEREFLEVYHKIREALGHTKLWEGDLYRLLGMDTAKGKLTLSFAPGKFLETIMCQWRLEHELNLALRKSGDNYWLPLRDTLLQNQADIETFCAKKPVMVGVSNLLLLKCAPHQYKPYIQRRKAHSLVGGAEGLYDTIGTCAFTWRRLPEADFDIKERVMTATGKELFAKDYLAGPFRGEEGAEPEEQWRTVLEGMERSGDASFDVTGFFIDLVRCAPQVTTVLVVRDPSYFQRFFAEFKVSSINPEFDRLGHRLRIEPDKIKNVDDWMVTSMLQDPEFEGAGTGFDALRWTFDGGFAFYQGMRRAVKKHLF